MSAPLDRESVIFRQRMLRQAGLYAGRIDGLYGTKTEAASQEWDRLYRELRDRYGELDGRTEGNLRTVLPAMQAKTRELLALLKREGIRAKVVSGTRTYAEQNLLFAQGRTKSGRIVTKARAGQSNHQFGLAIDLGIFSLEGAYLPESPLYDLAVELSRQIEGLARGADWSTPDRPHMELAHGLKLAEVRRRFEAGERILAS